MIAILLLLLAGAVYAQQQGVLLGGGDTLFVTCEGQRYAAAEQVGGHVLVHCEMAPVYPQVIPFLYLPVVHGG